MDPFSITCGVVGLVDTGINVARELKAKIDLYKSAEQDIKELTHEVDLCTSLLDIFGNSLDRPESAYPINVVKQTKRLVADMDEIFAQITTLLEGFDASRRASAKYVVNADPLRQQHAKLKGLQLSFVFMLSVCPPQRPTQSASSAGMASLGGLSGGQFTGTIQHLPVFSNDRGPINDGPVTYQATLTLTPSNLTSGQSAPANLTSDQAPEPDLTERLEELRKDRRLKKKLASLTSNPFFSKEVFSDMFSSRRTSNVTPRSGRMRASEPMSFDPSRVARHLALPIDEQARRQSEAELVKFQAEVEEKKQIEEEVYRKEHSLYEQEMLDIQKSRIREDTIQARKERQRLEGERDSVRELEAKRDRILREQRKTVEAVEAKRAVGYKSAAPPPEATWRHIEEQASRDADEILSYLFGGDDVQPEKTTQLGSQQSSSSGAAGGTTTPFAKTPPPPKPREVESSHSDPGPSQSLPRSKPRSYASAASLTPLPTRRSPRPSTPR